VKSQLTNQHWIVRRWLLHSDEHCNPSQQIKTLFRKWLITIALNQHVQDVHLYVSK